MDKTILNDLSIFLEIKIFEINELIYKVKNIKIYRELLREKKILEKYYFKITNNKSIKINSLKLICYEIMLDIKLLIIKRDYDILRRLNSSIQSGLVYLNNLYKLYGNIRKDKLKFLEDLIKCFKKSSVCIKKLYKFC